jgi:hypothetical protein
MVYCGRNLANSDHKQSVDLDIIPARMLRTLQKKLFLQSITYLVNNKSIMDGNVPIL